MMKNELLKKKVFVFDKDGTISLGNKPQDGAVELFQFLGELGKKVYVLTNNSSLTSLQHKKTLVEMGFPEGVFEVYSSTDATIEYLKTNNLDKRVFLMAVKQVEEEFIRNGINLVKDGPEVLVLAFDKEMTYEKFKKFCLYLLEDRMYIATHPDITCPTLEGPIPDVGSMIAAIKEATGRLPDMVIGKPNTIIMERLLSHAGVSREDVVIVGDRLETDMKLASSLGIVGVLISKHSNTYEGGRFFTFNRILDFLCYLKNGVNV